jgi:transcriptional regulator with XRE-family HTH domain
MRGLTELHRSDFNTGMANSGRRLKALRELHGLSQGELSRKAGVDRAYVSRVEAGKQAPSVEYLRRIAVALGLGELSKAVEVLERFRD